MRVVRSLNGLAGSSALGLAAFIRGGGAASSLKQARGLRVSTPLLGSDEPLGTHRLRAGPAPLPSSSSSAPPASAPQEPVEPLAKHGPIVVSGFVVTSPHSRVTAMSEHDYMLSHSIYTHEEVVSLQATHYSTRGWEDRLALFAVNAVRSLFDALSGYTHAPGGMTESKYLTRAIFLETVAAVPGMVASMSRHFESLRLMRRDNGWIHTLIGEAENERMHLLTFLAIRKPGLFVRAAVLVTQGVFFNAFFLAYILRPSLCHRFVGYLEEEAVRTYTHMIADLDAGHLPNWKTMAAPPIAVKYWRLPKEALMRDVLLAIRADEAIHRDVNHVFGSIKSTDKNPFA